jgi:hypothetical protein
MTNKITFTNLKTFFEFIEMLNQKGIRFEAEQESLEEFVITLNGGY